MHLEIKDMRFKKGILVAIATMATLCVAQAWATQVSGQVVDAQTGRALSGVRVDIMGQSASEVTDQKGQFVFANVSEGTVTLVAAYLGYEGKKQEVAVAGEEILVRISLQSMVKDLGATRVRPQLQGQANALNREMNSDYISNIISADQIGRFPDQNVAEALQRVPGVSVARDQGEGRHIQIRGTNPRLTAVKINGMEVPSPDGEDRSAAMDVIPANQLASIEVNKATTPEMDGDAIGGQVDLYMKKASSKEPRLDVSIAGGYNQEVQDFKTFEGSVNYAQRFGANGALGMSVGGGYSTRHFGSDNIEKEYGSLDVLDENEEETNESVDAVKEMELRDYDLIRTRIAANLNLDYQLGPGSELWLNTTFNRFADDEHRRRMVVKFGDVFETNTSVAEGSKFERELKDRYEVQDIFMVSGGGKHLLGKAMLDYSGSYSHAQEDEPDRQDINYVAKYDARLITKNSDFPKVILDDDTEDYNNASDYELDEIVREDNITTDQNSIAQFNLDIPVNDSHDWTVKTGGKFRAKKKDRTVKGTAYKWANEDLAPPTLDEAASHFKDSDFILGNYESLGDMPDPDKHRDVYKNNVDNLSGERDIGDQISNYEANENLYAGYLQSRAEIGKWMLLGGARFERTHLEYTGNAVNADNETVQKITETKAYNHILPALHVRYAITPKMNVRLAATQTISRPDYFDLVPYEYQEDNEIERGNPDLDASKATNFDLLFANYFQSVGVISAGYYYKWIEDLIYENTWEEGANEITSKRNGDWGQIHGVEVAWSQQFAFLPGALSSLGLYTNYNFAWSEAIVPAREDLITMPGQSDHMGNVALSFERWGFSGRIAWNWHGSYLAEVGEDDDADVYYDNSSRLDVSISQELSKGLIVFAEATNLTDQPLRYYVGSADNAKQIEYYGISAKMGIKYGF
jgi:TonB-dependent receptor